MAESKNTWQRIGLTPGKAALIGVLAAVLVGVLYRQYGGVGEPQQPRATRAANADRRRPPAVAAAPVKEPAPPGGPAEGGQDARSTRGLAMQPMTPVENESQPIVTPGDAAAAGRPVQALAESSDSRWWKSPDLAAVIRYDPFALPAAFPQPVKLAADPSAAQDGSPEVSDADTRAAQLAQVVERLRAELDQLRQRGVHVIVKQRGQAVAMIGDRTIHVGDEINGFIVTAIEPDGVRVEWIVVE